MLLCLFLFESVTVSSEFMIGFLQQKISFFIKSLRLWHTQAKIQMFFRYAHELSQLHVISWNSHQLFRWQMWQWQSSAPFSLIQYGLEWALSALSYDGYHNSLMDFLPRRRMDTAGFCCPYLTWLRGALLLQLCDSVCRNEAGADTSSLLLLFLLLLCAQHSSEHFTQNS